MEKQRLSVAIQRLQDALVCVMWRLRRSWLRIVLAAAVSCRVAVQRVRNHALPTYFIVAAHELGMIFIVAINCFASLSYGALLEAFLHHIATSA